MSVFRRALEGQIQAAQRRSGGWLVLVLDGATERAVSSLFTAQQLLRLRVALVCELSRARTPVPGAPALYFVSPSREAIEAVVSDCKKRIYASYALLFNSLRPDAAAELGEAFSDEPALANLITGIQALPLTVRQLNPLVFVGDCWGDARRCGRGSGVSEESGERRGNGPNGDTGDRGGRDDKGEGGEEGHLGTAFPSTETVKTPAGPGIAPCITPSLTALLRPSPLQTSVSGLLSYLFSLGASYGEVHPPLRGSKPASSHESNVTLRLPAMYAIGFNAARVCQEALALLSRLGVKTMRKPMSLLLVADRSCDPLALLKHSMAYGCLVTDTLPVLDGNRLQLGPVAGGGADGSMGSREAARVAEAADAATEPAPARSYTLDAQDALYSTIFANHFTDAAAAINAAVKAYKAKYADGNPEDSASAALWDLGKVKREKEECDLHTEVGSRVLKLAAERKIHELCEYESEPSRFAREVLQVASAVAASPGFVRGSEKARDAERLLLQYLLSTEPNVELLAGPERAIGGPVSEAIALLGKLTGQTAGEVAAQLRDSAGFILQEITAAGQTGAALAAAQSAKTGSGPADGLADAPIGSSPAGASAGGLSAAGSLSTAISAAASFVRTGVRQIVGTGNPTLAKAAAAVLGSAASQKTAQSPGAELRYRNFAPRPLQAELGGPVHELCLYVAGRGSLVEAMELEAAVAAATEEAAARRKQAAGASPEAQGPRARGAGREQARRVTVHYGCDSL